MDPCTMKKVYDIAKQTRLWAERTGKRKKFPYDLCGMCAIASGRLFRDLSRAGFRPQLVMSDNHCFVRLNGYAVDITATQFHPYERKKVLIKPVELLQDDDRSPWNYHTVSASRREMRRMQIEQGWPPSETVATPAVCGA